MITTRILMWMTLGVGALCAATPDTTYFYAGWGKPGLQEYVTKTSLKGRAYSQVQFVHQRPVILKHYAEDGSLVRHLEHAYDGHGNHLRTRQFNAQGKLVEAWVFQSDPQELALFRKVFGENFVPANPNFLIHRTYNDDERETGYFIQGVQGETLYSRVTEYREDRRKSRELIRDELGERILADRRYRYVDSENRTILEVFNDAGKMVQRVVLFDQHEILEE